MNPEFRRQLWLQFSATRLATLPLLLAAIFAAVYLTVPAAPAVALASVAAVLFALLVMGMGTFAAGGSIMDEIADHTWDQQRMSAMQPWAMTWGKLAGASAYGWYGGALCLLVAWPSALVREPLALVCKATLAAVLAGVSLQALLVAINLQLLKNATRVPRRGGLAALLLILLWGSGMVMSTVSGGQILWWGRGFERLDFALLSLAVFAAAALVGAWRSMAEVLAVRQLPWGWPALALAATAYISGFVWTPRTPVVGVVGLATSAVLTYFALLTEPQHRPQWQRVLNRAQGGHWRGALQQLPRWPTTLVLVLPFALLTTATFRPLFAEPQALTSAVLLQPLAFALLMGRDCALALCFAFAPNARRAGLSFAVLMLVLYMLLPWLLQATGGDVLVGLALPLLAGNGLSLAIAAVHLAVALGVLHWRWRTTAP